MEQIGKNIWNCTAELIIAQISMTALA